MLRAIDDANGDGISDPVADSSYKQLLGQAFFLTTDLDIQNLIDNSFDALASNYGVTRKPATQSNTDVVYYTDTAPLTDLSVTLATTVSTIPTETQVAIAFQTLDSATMIAAQISQYYNSITKRYELVVPVQAVLPGSISNVGANTIINTNIAGLSVTNPLAAYGGSDEESNSDLADRAELAFVGLDVGTMYGYKRTCANIPGVRDVMVITAGDSLMQRDYDEIRKKHVYGKVDIYIRGGENSQVEDKVGFLFNQLANERFNITSIDTAIIPPGIPQFFTIASINPVVTSLLPIYSVSAVRNVTEGENYDLLGNWTILKNTIAMQKITDVTLDLITGQMNFLTPLTTGDSITANYQYKVLVTNEIIIDPVIHPANPGQVSFTLLHSPIVTASYTIRKNGIVLTEITDYTLSLVNSEITLTTGLVITDSLAADYKYIVTVSSESVITSAIGGELTANLINGNVLESMYIGSDGISIKIDQHNAINTSIGIALTDVINVTYRYRDSEPILLSTQPVSRIISIVGSISGPLQADVNYFLNKTDDILLEGNSSQATRTVKIVYANGIPQGELLDTSETIVLINNEPKQLSNYGVDTSSIVVKQGATTFLLNSDYKIIPESDGTKVQLERSTSSTIPNGSQIQVYYSYGEILDITYSANLLVNTVQETINVSRHVTADVLVKEDLETFVDLDISVVLKNTADHVHTTNLILTALTNAFDKLMHGKGIAQSDVIGVIEGVENVESVVVPLNKMVKANGTQISREWITSSFEIYQSNVVTSYSTGPNALLYSTLGPVAADGFYAIFESDRPLILVSSPNDVDTAAGQGYIGQDGNIFISTIGNDLPSAHQYTVSYVVNGETGAKDIDVTSLEFLSVGTVNITTA
jgi:hypothetical protein